MAESVAESHSRSFSQRSIPAKLRCTHLSDPACALNAAVDTTFEHKFTLGKVCFSPTKPYGLLFGRAAGSVPEANYEGAHTKGAAGFPELSIAMIGWDREAQGERSASLVWNNMQNNSTSRSDLRKGY